MPAHQYAPLGQGIPVAGPAGGAQVRGGGGGGGGRSLACRAGGGPRAAQTSRRAAGALTHPQGRLEHLRGALRGTCARGGRVIGKREGSGRPVALPEALPSFPFLPPAAQPPAAHADPPRPASPLRPCVASRCPHGGARVRRRPAPARRRRVVARAVRVRRAERRGRPRGGCELQPRRLRRGGAAGARRVHGAGARRAHEEVRAAPPRAAGAN